MSERASAHSCREARSCLSSATVDGRAAKARSSGGRLVGNAAHA